MRQQRFLLRPGQRESILYSPDELVERALNTLVNMNEGKGLAFLLDISISPGLVPFDDLFKEKMDDYFTKDKNRLEEISSLPIHHFSKGFTFQDSKYMFDIYGTATRTHGLMTRITSDDAVTFHQLAYSSSSLETTFDVLDNMRRMPWYAGIESITCVQVLDLLSVQPLNDIPKALEHFEFYRFADMTRGGPQVNH